MSKEFIRIGGAREHNLKNLTLEIPRDKLVVITGFRQAVALRSPRGADRAGVTPWIWAVATARRRPV